jgi:tungstate transport system substrate-binding protein
LCLALTLILLAPVLAGCARRDELILASTTSTFDSGLLDVLLPAFERAHPQIQVKLIAVGSGEALALGRRRDADVLLVHAPTDEEHFMSSGHGRARYAVMSNDYVIVGPAADPAHVAAAASTADALRRIAAARAPFISRGDSSGTHRMELRLWRAAGIDSAQRVQVGQGMGEALLIASERGAYTLTDRGTYVALARTLRLDVLHEGDVALLNPYSVITVRASRHEAEAEVFALWLISADAQQLIARFGAGADGRPLFQPAAAAP